MRGTLAGHLPPEPEPFEVLVSAVLRRAVQDARQSAQPELRAEALGFLWTCVPDLAQALNLPELACKEAENGREWHTKADTRAEKSD